MEDLLILLHIPFPVYEPCESKCFQVGCWVGGWLIFTANMEILGVFYELLLACITSRSSVTNTQVIFFMWLSVSSSINNSSIFHNFGYFETAEVSFTSNVSANPKHLFFSFIHQNYKMYMCKYYTVCIGNQILQY